MAIAKIIRLVNEKFIFKVILLYLNSIKGQMSRYVSEAHRETH